MNKQKKKILWIDDEENKLNFYKEYLEIEGFDVTFCTDKEEVMGLLQRRFDFIILDIMIFINPKKDNVRQEYVDGFRRGLIEYLPLIVNTKVKFIIFSNLTEATFSFELKNKLKEYNGGGLYEGYFHKLTINPERLIEIINEKINL